MDQGREEPGEGMDLVYQTHLLKLVKHANQTTSSYLRHSCVREEILELITYKHKVFFFNFSDSWKVDNYNIFKLAEKLLLFNKWHRK